MAVAFSQLKGQDTSAMQHAGETLKRLSDSLRNLLKDIAAFQAANSDRVYSMGE